MRANSAVRYASWKETPTENSATIIHREIGRMCGEVDAVPGDTAAGGREQCSLVQLVAEDRPARNRDRSRPYGAATRPA